MRSYSIHVKLLYLISFLFLTGTAFGQDLGSSNKLFGGSKTSTAKKTVKKVPAKRKPVASKPKTTAKKRTPVPKKVVTTTHKPGQTSTAVKPKTTDNGKPTTAKVIITPAKSTETPGLTGAAADDLFEQLIEKGNTARDDRNYSAAEASYRRATTVKPKDARAVYGLGNLYVDQERWEDGETAYRTALQLDPNNAVAHIALSYVLIQPLYVADLSDRYEEAEKLARRAIELSPRNSLAFDQLGVALELRGLIGSETENAYRRSIQIDPTFAPAYAHLGRLLRRRGLTSESASAYQDAIKRSTDVATMILVADVMQSEQRYAESEPLLRKAIESDPRNPTALLMLGRALTTQGKFAEAESVLKTSLAISTNGFMANCLLGSLYARQGKFELAENALLQALRFVSSLEKRRLAQQFETVGDGYMKTGKSFNAARVYRQAVTLDAENQSVAGKLARAQHG